MKKKTSRALMIGAVSALVAVLGGLCFGLTKTVADFRIARQEPVARAILASTGETNSRVTLPVTFYDQAADPCVNQYEATEYRALINRTFEWQSCGEVGEAYEAGLTLATLDADHLPVAAEGGLKIQNRGLKPENFDRFFHEVEGKSQKYTAVMNLDYKDAAFSFEQDEFYPLADIETKAKDKRNHLFSLVLNVPFEVLADGHEEFTIVADDDTWVYLEDQILLDLGGVHSAMSGRFKITESGEIYSAVGNEDYAYSGLNVKADTLATLRIFHADRDSATSVFKLYFKDMLLNSLKQPQVASNASIKSQAADASSDMNDEMIMGENSDIADTSGNQDADTNANAAGGVEIAYEDVGEDGYMKPLGESSSFRPDRGHALLISAVIQLTLIAILVFAIAVFVPMFYRGARKKHEN